MGACRSALETRELPRQGAGLRVDGNCPKCKLPRSSSPAKTMPVIGVQPEAEGCSSSSSQGRPSRPTDDGEEPVTWAERWRSRGGIWRIVRGMGTTRQNAPAGASGRRRAPPAWCLSSITATERPTERLSSHRHRPGQGPASVRSTSRAVLGTADTTQVLCMRRGC